MAGKTNHAPNWEPFEEDEKIRPDEPEQRPGMDDTAKTQGKATRGHDEVATRPHLEGSEQGPS